MILMIREKFINRLHNTPWILPNSIASTSWIRSRKVTTIAKIKRLILINPPHANTHRLRQTTIHRWLLQLLLLQLLILLLFENQININSVNQGSSRSCSHELSEILAFTRHRRGGAVAPGKSGEWPRRVDLAAVAHVVAALGDAPDVHVLGFSENAKRRCHDPHHLVLLLLLLLPLFSTHLLQFAGFSTTQTFE